MLRVAGIVLILGFVALADVAGQRSGRGGRKLTTAATCAADLGQGVKSSRKFCDVIIATNAAESVAMAIPPHTGAATLMFDLHNRFTVQAGVVDPEQAFVRYAALVAIVRNTGQPIERAAVAREYRSVQDLFDRIGGGPRPSGFKAVAPGQPEPIRVTIPAGVPSVGIVGVRLEATTRAGSATHDPPGRAIAIVSNLRIEYTPR